MPSEEGPRNIRGGSMSAAITAEALTARITPVLRRAYGESRHAAKRLSRDASVSPRCAENWLDGLNAPRAAELVRLMAQCDDLAAEIEQLVAESRAAHHRTT